jgi:hypothetical protein
MLTLSESVAPGASASFNAAASTPSGCAPPTVQWQVSTDGGATWANVFDGTATSLTVNGVVSAQSGSQYRALFTNGAGSTPTAGATLTVQATSGPVDPVVLALLVLLLLALFGL